MKFSDETQSLCEITSVNSGGNSFRRYLHRLIPITLVILPLLSACGGGGGGGGGSRTTAKPLEVATVSGVTMAMDGTWVSPCDRTFSQSGSDGSAVTMEINGTTITTTTDTWTGDPNCVGTPTQTSPTTATGTVDPSTGAIGGWATVSLDSTGMAVFTSTTAPQATDGSGPLSDNEPFSLINIADSSNTGTAYTTAYIVDDTGSNPILYGLGGDNTLGTVGLTNLFYVANGSTSSSTIYLVTASGGAIPLDGSWNTGCVPTAPDSSLVTMAVTGNTWTFSQSTWSGNTTCSGASTQVNYMADLAADATQNISGWVDDTNTSASGPTAADGSGALADNVAYTPLIGTITSSDDPNVPVGAQLGLNFVVDNSGTSGPLLYFASNPTAAWNYGPLQ